MQKFCTEFWVSILLGSHSEILIYIFLYPFFTFGTCRGVGCMQKCRGAPFRLRHFAQCWHLNTWRFSMPRNIWPWWQVPLVSYGGAIWLSVRSTRRKARVSSKMSLKNLWKEKRIVEGRLSVEGICGLSLSLCLSGCVCEACAVSMALLWCHLRRLHIDKRYEITDKERATQREGERGHSTAAISYSCRKCDVYVVARTRWRLWIIIVCLRVQAGLLLA